MKWDIQYEENQKGIEKGCADVLAYLGQYRYNLLVEVCKNIKTDEGFDNVKGWFAFAGVRGWPVKAMTLKYNEHGYQPK